MTTKVFDTSRRCRYDALMRFIGDVHGKYRRYRELIRDVPESIQVGDMGVGFIDFHGEMRGNPPFDAMSEGEHYFIRGNHDNPNVCRNHKFWIADGTFHKDVFCIGGATSIDRHMRVEGFTWWADEQLSIRELNMVTDTFVTTQPEIVVTHECPESISDLLCKRNNMRKFSDPSATRQALQSMFEQHQPKIWIHGHWHMSFDEVVEGTRFICLNELEVLDL